MKRTITLFALVALALSATPRADARTTQTWRYVATESGSDLYALVSNHNTPAGRVSPGGSIQFVASGESVTLRVDDAAALPGKQLDVWVASSADDIRWQCVPDSETLSFASTPGTRYYVGVYDVYGTLCDGGGTVGTITVVA
jgi:hypothetical protein